MILLTWILEVLESRHCLMFRSIKVSSIYKDPHRARGRRVEIKMATVSKYAFFATLTFQLIVFAFHLMSTDFNAWAPKRRSLSSNTSNLVFVSTRNRPLTIRAIREASIAANSSGLKTKHTVQQTNERKSQHEDNAHQLNGSSGTTVHLNKSQRLTTGSVSRVPATNLR